MAGKKIKVTPEENAKALKREVQVKLRTKYLERFDEFVIDADTKIDKGTEVINDNSFALEVVFNSESADDPRAKDLVNSFETVISLTKQSLAITRIKREAAIQLHKLVDKNEKILAIDLLMLFDKMVGA